MSDRFYIQQCEVMKIKPSDLIYSERYPDTAFAKSIRSKLSGKRSNASGSKPILIANICDELGINEIQGIQNMPIKDLELLLSSLQLLDGSVIPTMPSGTRRKPYIDEISTLTGTVANLDKMTISGCKAIIEALS